MSSDPTPRNGNKKPVRGKTALAEIGFIADLPRPMRPSDSGPQHASWSRLDHLYRITKLLSKFKNTETTVAAVLALVSNTLPLRTAILIEATAGPARMSIWKTEGVSDQKLRAAGDHAASSYSYLSGPRSGSAYAANANIVRDGGASFKSAGESRDGNKFITLPLVVERGPVFGAFQWECATRCNETDLTFVNAVANEIAVALDRHQALQGERSARAEAGDAESRMRFLANASALLAESLDYRRTWEDMARLAVHEIADYCFIDFLEDDVLQRITVLSPKLPAGLTPKQVKNVLASVVRQVLKTQRAVVYPVMGSNEFESGRPASSRISGHPANRQKIEKAGRSFESYICVPLHIGQRFLGTLTLVSSQTSRVYGHSDLLLVRDLAGRAIAAFENAQLHAEALRAVRSRDDLLSAVSHDLKGSLTTVVGFLRIYLGKAFPEELLICDRKHLEAIQRAANQMRALVDDLLDTASIDARHLSVEREACAVGPLVEEAMELPQSLAMTKGLHLKACLPADLHSVSVDRHRILQVFSNLIGNAVKFTPEGGTVSVHAEQFGDSIRFCVQDTGAGITEEEMPYVFDRFWQAKGTKRLGTGLGLFIVKGIVEGHGGRIWIESDGSTGSKFFFTLPLSG